MNKTERYQKAYEIAATLLKGCWENGLIQEALRQQGLSEAEIAEVKVGIDKATAHNAGQAAYYASVAARLKAARKA